MATGINSTYNILGAGGDNIGQLRTIGSTTTRYYYLKDHLATVKMEIKVDGTIDSYNDYYPYGSLMPGRSSVQSADPRYKFTSKERDTETGYDYFGARYYDSWLGRWLQVDPLADKYLGWSPYNYCHMNPLNRLDLNGMGDQDNNKGESANFWNKLLQPLDSFLNLFRSNNRDENKKQDIQENVGGAKDIKILKETEKVAKSITGTNIYISVTYGAQSGEIPVAPTFGLGTLTGVTHTSNGGYVILGADAAFSIPIGATKSVSLGYMTNPNLQGLSQQISFGVLGIGVEFSTPFSNPSSMYSPDFGIGIVFSNSPSWIDFNVSAPVVKTNGL